MYRKVIVPFGGTRTAEAVLPFIEGIAGRSRGRAAAGGSAGYR
jgi:hypothetical protein